MCQIIAVKIKYRLREVDPNGCRRLFQFFSRFIQTGMKCVSLPKHMKEAEFCRQHILDGKPTDPGYWQINQHYGCLSLSLSLSLSVSWLAGRGGGKPSSSHGKPTAVVGRGETLGTWKCRAFKESRETSLVLK